MDTVSPLPINKIMGYKVWHVNMYQKNIKDQQIIGSTKCLIVVFLNGVWYKFQHIVFIQTVYCLNQQDWIQYFEIHVFNVKTFVLLVLEMYSFYVLFQKLISLKVFHKIYQNWNFQYLNSSKITIFGAFTQNNFENQIIFTQVIKLLRHFIIPVWA